MNLNGILRIANHTVYSHPLPAGHRFPMLKYELIPAQLLYEGTLSPINFFTPDRCKDEIISWTHTKEWLDKLKNQGLSARNNEKLVFPNRLN